MIKKIVVTGPESTGKSTLCEQLANHFETDWVREYARRYLLEHGIHYKWEDLFTIATGQLTAEDEKTAQLGTFGHSTKPLFIDTDMYVIKVWSEFVFNKCDNRILNFIVERKYDLYLLCHPDLPWIADSLREYPDSRRREQLFHQYKDALINQSVPWVEIKGTYEERLHAAIDAVQKHI